MEMIWDSPEAGCYKINVHCSVSQLPLANGNTNGVGVVIRDFSGKDLFKASGPMNHLSEEEAILAGIQTACIHAVSKGWDITHIETVHRGVYETIRLQEHILIPENQLEALRLFNTVQANHFVEGSSDRRLSCVPIHMNASATYLADYGMENLSAFAEVKGTVGNLQYYLDRDMGMVIGALGMDMVDNLGLGEVIDPPPPALPISLKKRKCPDLLSAEVKLSSGSPPLDFFEDSRTPWFYEEHDVLPQDSSNKFGMKGKDKLYQEFSFYDNGRMSERAVEVIQSGCLVPFSPTFGNDIIDLEAPVGFGFHAKDVLHHAVQGTLTIFSDILKRYEEMDRQFRAKHSDELLPVGQVVSAMGSKDASGSISVQLESESSKKARRASSI